MASRDDDGQTYSPEAMRQLRAVIDLVAAGKGVNISGADSTALATIMSGLTRREQVMLATSPDAVLGKLAAIVTHYADTELKRQEERRGTGAPDPMQEPGGEKDGMPRILHKRMGDFMDRLAEAASNTRESGDSSASYQRGLPGRPVPGNADMRGFNMADYYTSPQTFALRSMGVNDNTYAYLHKEGFSKPIIEKAARDADKLGFSTNDQRTMKNIGTIHQKGNNPAKTMGLIENFQKGLQGDKAFQAAALVWHKAKTPEEKEAAWKKIEELSKQQAKKARLPEDMAKQRDKAVLDAIEGVTRDITKKEVDEAIKKAPAAEIRATNPAGAASLGPETQNNLEEAIKAKLGAIGGAQPIGEPASQSAPVVSKPTGAPSQPTSALPKPTGSPTPPAASTARPGGTAP